MLRTWGATLMSFKMPRSAYESLCRKLQSGRVRVRVRARVSIRVTVTVQCRHPVAWVGCVHVADRGSSLGNG